MQGGNESFVFVWSVLCTRDNSNVTFTNTYTKTEEKHGIMKCNVTMKCTKLLLK